MAVELILPVVFVLVAAAAWAIWALSKSQSGTGRSECDLRRSIVIAGRGQNDPACVTQRRAIKPVLMTMRAAGINVVEIYGEMAPRRNGKPLEWVSSRKLSKSLGVASDFHVVCFDDDGGVMLRSRRPVSEAVLAELISAGAQLALPSPADASADPEQNAATTADGEPAPQDAWTAGALR